MENHNFEQVNHRHKRAMLHSNVGLPKHTGTMIHSESRWSVACCELQNLEQLCFSVQVSLTHSILAIFNQNGCTEYGGTVSSQQSWMEHACGYSTYDL